jgi:hypothetical protein
VPVQGALARSYRIVVLVSGVRVGLWNVPQRDADVERRRDERMPERCDDYLAGREKEMGR